MAWMHLLLTRNLFFLGVFRISARPCLPPSRALTLAVPLLSLENTHCGRVSSVA